MRLSVSETAKLTGVSVRALHYYDEIGLLRPSATTEAGYRYYDEEALTRLQQIMFYKELGFPLKEVIEIMRSPNYDRRDALKNQRELLLLKRDHIQELIRLIDDTMKGESIMSFKEFDTKEIEEAKERYAEEVKERWGGSRAYEESLEKTAQYSEGDWKKVDEDSGKIFKAFADSRDKDPGDPQVQELVALWQEHITKNFYTCTKEILAGLGQMYTADPRFTENIDKFGEGTAAFMSAAIEKYCE